ncbi:MAG: universal stress protein [Phenylobacterium sp.]|uniref:universal stress protein n=1 Tax=Phenylobacterium sp. TaxID=1871053 RepID=UPI00272FD8EB|nr:universal stress protein [Phenylobacterium sp.]MDP2009008.1 universal stress protein [Phenylobacterium sp.]
MTNPSWRQGPPRTILLATDLSSRCDRAVQRGLQLAKLWNSRLIILNVIEPVHTTDRNEMGDLPSWRRPADPRRVAQDQLRRQFGESVQGAEVRVVEGEPVAAIEEAARELGADLIVTGVARDEAFGRYVLGSTVDRLARQTSVPLLVVKSRVWPYEEILVATDFSEASQQALTAADRFFPTAPLTALHGWEVPYAGFLDAPGFREQWKEQEKQGCEDFLQRSQLSFEGRARVRVLVEHGSPEVLVRQYMLDKEVDLVVIGTHGGSGLFDKRLGGTAKRILEYAPADVLLIREPRAVRRGEPSR